VSGRNTPPGSGRSKPSGPWETAEAERRGTGIPRRGSARARRSDPQREGGAGTRTPRAGSAAGAENPRGGGSEGRGGGRRRTGEKTREADEVLKGERKARSVEPHRSGNRPVARSGGRRQGPDRKVERTEAGPRSRTSGYAGS
jgi:hypothetical protein